VLLLYIRSSLVSSGSGLTCFGSIFFHIADPSQGQAQGCSSGSGFNSEVKTHLPNLHLSHTQVVMVSSLVLARPLPNLLQQVRKRNI